MSIRTLQYLVLEFTRNLARSNTITIAGSCKKKYDKLGCLYWGRNFECSLQRIFTFSDRQSNKAYRRQLAERQCMPEINSTRILSCSCSEVMSTCKTDCCLVPDFHWTLENKLMASSGRNNNRDRLARNSSLLEKLSPGFLKARINTAENSPLTFDVPPK